MSQSKNLDNFIFDCGFLSPYKLIYITVCKTVYLWAYDSSEGSFDGKRQKMERQGPILTQVFDQNVMGVALTDPLKHMKNFKKGDKILIVATVSSIKIFGIHFE